METDLEYFDYPKEPIGGGNPYYRCSACGISDPQINGRLENHHEHCSWRISKLESIRKAMTPPTEPCRCKDCKWYKPEPTGQGDCNHPKIQSPRNDNNAGDFPVDGLRCGDSWDRSYIFFGPEFGCVHAERRGE